jgi:sugar/nucleoside kinase (ribokinase family)
MVAVGVFVGLSTLDLIQHVDAAPEANEKITAHAQWVAAGGPATNAAVAFAALGGAPVLVTALGSGPAADVVRADLARCGVSIVDATPEAVDQLPVSSITVVPATGERSVVSTDASGISIDTVPELRHVITGADVVLVDGHHPVLAAAAARVTKQASTPLVLDAGRWRPVMAEVIPNAAAVICSADFRWPGTASVTSSARAVLEQGVPIVIVTQGGDPVLWWHAGESGAIEPPRVRALDTAGAGDVFHGAYCYFTATRGATDVPALAAASAQVAALSCQYPGTRSWIQHC